MGVITIYCGKLQIYPRLKGKALYFFLDEELIKGNDNEFEYSEDDISTLYKGVKYRDEPGENASDQKWKDAMFEGVLTVKSDKFTSAIQQLIYIINNVIPTGTKINGALFVQYPDYGEFELIRVINNRVFSNVAENSKHKGVKIEGAIYYPYN